MQDIVISSLRPTDFGLSHSDISDLGDHTVVVTRWNWDYKKAHDFQRAALELVQNTTNLRILICCSHPEVLTYGRGLQKPRKGENLELKDFNPDENTTLPYPFYRVERGGGLTFHHPGQFIFYPILKLSPQKLSLSRMTDEIFDFSIDVLKSWGLSDVHHENKLLGLWHKDKKLASMGIAIEKLTTFHGMALNILSNEKMKETLKSLNPCGLDSEIYTAVENLAQLPSLPLETFKEQFLKRISHEWK